jgi:hypothetical protein
VRPSRGWQACGRLLVSMCLVSTGIFAGCQKAGGGRRQAEEPPPSPTSPSTTPPPVASSVAGINLTAAQASLPAGRRGGWRRTSGCQSSGEGEIDAE